MGDFYYKSPRNTKTENYFMPARVRVREQGAMRKKVPSANKKDPTATAIIPYGKTKSPLGRNRMLV